MRHPKLAATAVFLLAFVCGCCGLGAFRAEVHPPFSAHPRDMAEPMHGSVVLTADGRRLLYSMPPSCATHGGVAVRSGTSVVLTLTAYPLPPPGCGTLRSPELVAIDVNGVVGVPTVTDATSGATLPVFAERGALHPVPLPPDNFSPYGEAGSLVPDFGGPGAATLVERFRPAGGGTGEILVVQTTGRWNRPPDLVTTATTVRGHPGVAAPGILGWAEGGQTVAIVWRGGAPAELAALAASLVGTVPA